MLAWLCSMLNAGSKLWLAPVKSSDILVRSRSLWVRHVLCWIKSAALHVPCPALLSTSLCLILIFMQFLTRRTTESSNLVWTPSSGSSAKIAGKLFHPVHHLFSKGEGKQLFEQGPEPDSWTPGGAASQAATAARSSQALLAAAWEGHPAPVWYLNPPDPQIHLLLPAHQLVSGSGFSQRPWESWLYTCLHILALDQVWGLQCLGMPGYASSLLCASLFSPLRRSCYLVKWLLCHFCSNPAQFELFRPPWRQIFLSALATASSYQRMLNFQWGVAYEQSPLAWSIGPVIPVCRFHAGAVLRSIVFSWSVFLLITHLYESVLALCQSSCQCECNCQGLYIYFTDEICNT